MSSRNCANASVAEVALAHEQLTVAGPVAQRDEDELALVAHEHDATRDAHFVVGGIARLELLVPAVAQAASECVRSKPIGYGSTPRAAAPRPSRVERHVLGRAAVDIAGRRSGPHWFRSKMMRRPYRVSQGS